MQHTKNDLCGDSATLDWEAGRKTAESAVGHILERIEVYHHRIRYATARLGKQLTGVTNDAGYLLREAQQLVVAMETLYMFRESELRSEFKVVNKPNVKEE